jgi:hypothetical protein
MKHFRLAFVLVTGALLLAACGGMQAETSNPTTEVATSRTADRTVDGSDTDFEAMRSPTYWVGYGSTEYQESWVCWTIKPGPSLDDFELAYTPPGYTWRLGVVTKGDTHHIFEDPWPVEGDVFETGGYDQVIACKVLDGEDPSGAIVVRKKDAGYTYLAGAVFTVEPGGYVMTEIEPGVHCIDGLALGNYTVTETTPPAGYAADDAPQVLAAAEGKNCSTDLPTDRPIFWNTPVPGIVKVFKVDEAGAPLAGATFHLTGPDAYEESCTTVLPDASCVFGDLVLGDYTLDEVGLPAGYSLGEVTLAGVGAVSLPYAFAVGLGSEPGEGQSFTFTVENIPDEREFSGETAWAANGDEPGQLPYNPDDDGNWATYVEYAAKTTTLFAGQHIPVGSVVFLAPVGGEVTITVDLIAGWTFEDVLENLMVQDYVSAPSGNPAPGLFDHKATCDVALATCSIVVPEAAFYGVHVNVGTWVAP